MEQNGDPGPGAYFSYTTVWYYRVAVTFKKSFSNEYFYFEQNGRY